MPISRVPEDSLLFKTGSPWHGNGYFDFSPIGNPGCAFDLDTSGIIDYIPCEVPGFFHSTACLTLKLYNIYKNHTSSH